MPLYVLPLLLVLFGIGMIILVLRNFIRYIPNTRVGIVEKLVSGRGSLKSGFIALNGELGFQPGVLRGGWHLFMPFQYRVHTMPLVTIPQGKLGYVFARDGASLAPTQALASNVTANNFQDAADFLTNGGQRGPQRMLLREGTYAINLAQFIVLTSERIYCLSLNRDEDEMVRRMADVIISRGGFEPIVI